MFSVRRKLHPPPTKCIYDKEDTYEEEDGTVMGYKEENDRPRRWFPPPSSSWHLDSDYESGQRYVVLTNKNNNHSSLLNLSLGVMRDLSRLADANTGPSHRHFKVVINDCATKELHMMWEKEIVFKRRVGGWQMRGVME